MYFPTNLFSFLKLYILISIAFMLTGCVSVDIFHYGSVMESENNTPLQDVEISLAISYNCFNPIYVSGGPTYELPIRKTLTDDKGKFYFPTKVSKAEHSICWSTKHIEYNKPGYYQVTDSEFNNKVFLDLWTHALNSSYCNYQRRGYYQCSKPMSPEQLEKIGFVPADEKGVFYRRKGSQFTKIFQNFKGISFYDSTSNQWITLDNRAKIVEPFVDPSGKIKKNKGVLRKLYTDGEKIFIRHNSELKTSSSYNRFNGCDLQYSKGEIETILPYKGDVSLILPSDGGVIHPPGNSFFTIEDSGRLICHYGRSSGLKLFYNNEITEKFCDIHFFRAYGGSALPKSNIDPTLDQTEFIKLYRRDDERYLLLTRTPTYWHIYKMELMKDPQASKRRFVFIDLACFPRPREVQYFTPQGFISFKGEGIRKFDIKENQYVEDKKFHEKSHNVITGCITDIKISYDRHKRFVYAVSGEDKIYRFSYDGVPDYPIQLKKGLKQALDLPKANADKNSIQERIHYSNSVPSIKEEKPHKKNQTHILH